MSALLDHLAIGRRQGLEERADVFADLGLLVAGQIRTAELGSMQVTEQVDAIRAMGADPVQKLIFPRVVAATLMLPLLTVLADVLGIGGGMVIADLQYGIRPSFFLNTSGPVGVKNND